MLISTRGAVVFVALVIGACVVQQQPADPAGGTASSDQSDPTGCGAACAHYLECKGINDESQWTMCTNECQSSTELDPAVVAQYPTLDCATAIELVESNQGGTAEGGNQGGNGGACNADCTSCVWDGSSCYSNSMAAMGTVIECESCCCAQGGPAPRWD